VKGYQTHTGNICEDPTSNDVDVNIEKMQMRKQRQRTGEQRSMRMVRRTCLNGKRFVLKKQRGGLNIKKQNHLFFSFPT
jgi:hypothetical protein